MFMPKFIAWMFTGSGSFGYNADMLIEKHLRILCFQIL